MNGTNKKVLIIDDEPDLLFVLSIRLKNRSYDVDTTSEPVSALALISAKEYDIIFCDLTMPGSTTCFDILNHARAKSADSKFYFITGHTDVSTQVQNAIKEIGEDSVLVKPLDFKELILILET